MNAKLIACRFNARKTKRGVVTTRSSKQHEGTIASGPVAQWIRHRPTEPGIAGSSPAGVIYVLILKNSDTTKFNHRPEKRGATTTRTRRFARTRAYAGWRAWSRARALVDAREHERARADARGRSYAFLRAGRFPRKRSSQALSRADASARKRTPTQHTRTSVRCHCLNFSSLLQLKTSQKT